MAARGLVDVKSLAPERLRAGGNVVHAHIARIATAFRPPPHVHAPRTREGRSVFAVLVLTVLINMLAIAAPLVTLAVFDYVVRDGASVTLAVLVATGGLAIVCELMMRRERAVAAADVGLRAAGRLSSSFFSQLLRRELQTEEPVSAQVQRFRMLRRLRRFLTGPTVSALLDAPFSVLITLALLMYFGPIGLVPLGAVLGYLLSARLLRPHARQAAQHGARARERLRVALSEAATKRETLDEIGAGAIWGARIESLAVESATRRGKEAAAEAALDAAAHAIGALSLVAALWIGAGLVMGGHLSVGAAIAALMLTWRAIAPMEVLFRSWAQVSTAYKGARSARAAEAGLERGARLPAPKLEGRLSARGLVVRGGPGMAALRGVTFDVAPGELVAVCGPAGAGKSTLLTALLGLTKLEAGAVLADGVDVRGLDAAAYRTQVAWAPQKTSLFHGTVAQNIRLFAPAADDEAMRKALARAGVMLPHPQLTDGLATRLMSGGAGQIDESLRVKIMLAALYAKDARIYLLDDPGAFLDRDGDRAFMEMLASLRGRATVILVTNRPSHMRACDRIIRIEHGMLMSDGRVGQVLG
jgi:ATP-binding cassette, subfamily C, bacterial LapB